MRLPRVNFWIKRIGIWRLESGAFGSLLKLKNTLIMWRIHGGNQYLTTTHASITHEM